MYKALYSHLYGKVFNWWLSFGIFEKCWKIFLKSTFPLHAHWADSHLSLILHFLGRILGYSRHYISLNHNLIVFLSEIQSFSRRWANILQVDVVYPRWRQCCKKRLENCFNDVLTVLFDKVNSDLWFFWKSSQILEALELSTRRKSKCLAMIRQTESCAELTSIYKRLWKLNKTEVK